MCQHLLHKGNIARLPGLQLDHLPLLLLQHNLLVELPPLRLLG